MDKEEQRKHLKRLQMICWNRSDAELPDVCNRLAEELNQIASKIPRGQQHVEPEASDSREETSGQDRKQRGGRTRSE